MCLVFAAKPQCKLIVELAKNMLAGGWIKVVVDWYVLLWLLQTLHEAFSRCASILSQSSRPDDVAVQVKKYAHLQHFEFFLRY